MQVIAASDAAELSIIARPEMTLCRAPDVVVRNAAAGTRAGDGVDDTDRFAWHGISPLREAVKFRSGGSTGPRPAHGFGQVLYNVSGSVGPAGKHLPHGVEGERPDDLAGLVRVERSAGRGTGFVALGQHAAGIGTITEES